MDKIKIAVFASGSGTNAEKIFNYFAQHQRIEVAGLFTNNPQAYAITRAINHQIPYRVFDKATFNHPEKMLAMLDELSIDVVVLAGFLWLIPEFLVNRFQDRMINIHPALLPKFGGKGMYGMRVHQAVIESDEPESGITIHLVNQEYDKGRIIYQATCPVTPEETADSLAKKIHQLEYRHYPEVIERWLLDLS